MRIDTVVCVVMMCVATRATATDKFYTSAEIYDLCLLLKLAEKRLFKRKKPCAEYPRRTAQSRHLAGRRFEELGRSTCGNQHLNLEVVANDSLNEWLNRGNRHKYGAIGSLLVATSTEHQCGCYIYK